ncbi:MAG: hypothetical protein COX29_03210 [Candidatus Moranbacteria bacterium CG23_combo_of_CG06-09_8_20_14_all_35_22]|nr:MAG: hypothetical protein COX29_03210 [Candidatus Moranbacteria bacterium CG23_combo_of_CG06-09_8_20_14_all_35_22]
MKKKIVFIGIFIFCVLFFSCNRNPEEEILKKLNFTYANLQKNKCQLNSLIMEFNTQREMLIASLIFQKKELLPQKIEPLNIQCP